MIEVQADSPYKLIEANDYEATDVAEALNRALFTEGLAIVHSIGLSDSDRRAMIAEMTTDECLVEKDVEERGPTYYSGISPAAIEKLKQAFANDPLQEY